MNTPNPPSDPENDGSATSDFETLIVRARQGCAQSMNRMLDQCRDYLLLIANRETQSQLKQKIGASDIVQQSMINATQAIDRFEGSTKEEFLAWARGIVINGIRQNIRYLSAEKRASNREIAIDAQASGLNHDLIDQMLTPSTDASLNEQAQLLRTAMHQLSSDDQTVITLRVWEKLSFMQIAEQMQKTPAAVQKQWSRAIIRLKTELEKLDAL